MYFAFAPGCLMLMTTSLASFLSLSTSAASTTAPRASRNTRPAPDLVRFIDASLHFEKPLRSPGGESDSLRLRLVNDRPDVEIRLVPRVSPTDLAPLDQERPVQGAAVVAPVVAERPPGLVG